MVDTSATSGQDETIAFLSDPASYPEPPERVGRIDTHGAMVFLAGERVYKIKRAVRLPYFDFSTIEKRRAACEREVEINRLTAPDLYLGVVPVTRQADGSLAFGGDGEPVEWAVEMARFDQERLLDAMAGDDALPLDVMPPLADRIAGYHERAPVHRNGEATQALAAVADQVGEALSGVSGQQGDPATADYRDTMQRYFKERREQLSLRESNGYVRRCHGDLHLRNIVLLEDGPTLFDAIEFDEAIATIDVLYDLAFLLMDLWRRDKRRHASAVFNRYLWRASSDGNIAALGLMPLFLSLRAGVRAMVTLDAVENADTGDRGAPQHEAMEYYRLAAGFLAPEPARLIAIGGLSGTGKSTLAAALAPRIGAPPGALHLRSDVERKLIFGLRPEEQLKEEGYSEETTRRVYSLLGRKASLALAAGHSVILDAVFARPAEREAAEQAAQEAGVAFTGLWLSAPREELTRRVETREGDASDAGADIVRKQSGYAIGAMKWRTLSAEGTPEAVLGRTRRLPGIASEG